tara:strand:+ start:560 stop:1063 length:504 start_codon:yes stop_codon:yes gene_type:complete
MKKLPLKLKPNILNALLPELLKNLFYSLIFSAILFGVLYGLIKFKIISFTISRSLIVAAIILIIGVFLPTITKIFVLSNTYYYFFKDHLVTEFKFFKVKRTSVPYSQIVNIIVNITIWDRFCKAGDIIIHTAEDKQSGDLVLKYIKDPSKIEHSLYQMIGKRNQHNL